MRCLPALASVFLLVAFVGCGDPTPAATAALADAGTQDSSLDLGSFADLTLVPPQDVTLPEVSQDSSSLDTATTAADAGYAWTPLIAERPYGFRLPAQYDPSKPWPLVVLLHGYAESAAFIDGWMHMSDAADKLGYVLAVPEGRPDATGMRYWNATDVCCDLYGVQPDDVGYLKAVLSDMKAKFNIDAKRVYAIGHSNGAFMAHRLACEAADQVVAIAALSGVNYLDASKCKPTQAVAVLQIHGTLDPTIGYWGGMLPGGAYPGALASTAAWADRDGCEKGAENKGFFDLDALLFGPETAVQTFANCKGGAAELWSVVGGAHFLAPKPDWPAKVFGWLQDHARP